MNDSRTLQWLYKTVWYQSSFGICHSTFQPVQCNFSSIKKKIEGQQTLPKHQIMTYSRVPQNRSSIRLCNIEDLLVSTWKFNHLNMNGFFFAKAMFQLPYHKKSSYLKTYTAILHYLLYLKCYSEYETSKKLAVQNISKWN